MDSFMRRVLRHRLVFWPLETYTNHIWGAPNHVPGRTQKGTVTEGLQGRMKLVGATGWLATGNPITELISMASLSTGDGLEMGPGSGPDGTNFKRLFRIARMSQ
uniref:Uncharacterized protein n=1 Tax=Eutreptiella gymnastica TaxID=73025 RepID=A0A7S4C7M3_9EUGL